MSEVLPPSWTWAHLGDLAFIAGGLTKGKKRKETDELKSVPYLRVANVQRGFLVLDDVRLILATDSEIQKYRLEQGDVLFNEGGDRDKLGRGWIWSAQIPLCIHQNHVFRARLISKDLVQPKLVSWYGNTAGKQYFWDEGKQTTNLASINQTKLKGLPIPVPPAPEQQRIVEALDSYLSRLDAAAEGLKRVETNLKRYRASVLKAAVEGSLVPTEAELAEQEGRDYEPASVLLKRVLKERRRQWEEAELEKLRAKGKEPKNDKWKSKYKEPVAPDTSELPDLPSGWCWASLPSLGELSRGMSKHRPRNDPGLFGGPYPFIQTGDIRNSDTFVSGYTQTYSEKGLHQSKLWPAGTLCITIAANIAETGILTFDACFPDSIVGFTGFGNDTSIRFVEACVRSIQPELEGSASATAQKNINLGTLQELVIPLPPGDEQARIIEALDRILSIAVKNQAAVSKGLKKITRLRQSILKWAFEGKLVDQDPNDEPASELLARIRRLRQESAIQTKTSRKRKPATSTTPKKPMPQKDRLEFGEKAEPTVEEVFNHSGFDPENLIDIEAFYDLLRQEKAAGHVDEAERDVDADGLPIIRLRNLA